MPRLWPDFEAAKAKHDQSSSVMDSSDEFDDGWGAISFPAGNDDFRQARNACAQACRQFNDTPEDAPPEIRVRRWLDIVGGPDRNRTHDEGAVTGEITFRDPTCKPLAPFVKPPIFMDYGLRVRIGGTTFINRYCMIMDTPVADVVIGERCNIGPHCSIISVGHPLGGVERNTKRSSMGKGIRIGDGVWIGAGAIIMGGVIIGDGAVIGAGSLVNRDIPPKTLAYGVPARLRKILKDDEVCRVSGTVATLEEALKVGQDSDMLGLGEDSVHWKDKRRHANRLHRPLRNPDRIGARNVADLMSIATVLIILGLIAFLYPRL